MLARLGRGSLKLSVGGGALAALDYAFAPTLTRSTSTAAAAGTIGSVSIFQYEVRA